MEFCRGHGQDLSHAAVDVHPQDLELGATIGFAVAAGGTAPAIQVGLDRAAVARRQTVRTIPGIDHLDPELVAEDAGIVEKWLAPEKGMQIGAADADASDPHQGPARTGDRGRLFRRDKMTGLFQYDLEHGGKGW